MVDETVKDQLTMALDNGVRNEAMRCGAMINFRLVSGSSARLRPKVQWRRSRTEAACEESCVAPTITSDKNEPSRTTDKPSRRKDDGPTQLRWQRSPELESRGTRSTRIPEPRTMAIQSTTRSFEHEKLGQRIYTTRDVVDEIRDQATRQRLQVLPYELNYVEPSAESLKHVTEFSKKTGDYSSLSATDLRLIAVVYQLEKQFGDVSRLRNDPVVTKTYSTTNRLLENPRGFVGFFLPPKEEKNESTELSSKLDSLSLSTPEAKAKDEEEPCQTENCDDSESEDEDSGTAEDEEGWITPGNVQSALSKARREDGDESSDGQPIPVACLSTDFAIQNVLLHMGLRLTSVDGILIKRLRTYVLRCFGCFKTTSAMTKRFCPSCGNPTLKKVAVTVNPETGCLEYHISKRKRISTRGTKFSLPTFKGGKHVSNPILSADQPAPENRLSKKALQRLDVLDPDYLARDSPFLMKDVTSRSAVLGVRSLHQSDHRRNPNTWTQGRKRGGKKH